MSGRHRRTSWTACSGACRRTTRICACSTKPCAEYGLSRFVTETMGALSTIWILDLPRSGAWIQDNFLELTRRAAPLRLSEAWDLPRALAQAAALTQTVDLALSGLSNLPDTKGRGASPELIAGLACFGAGLASTPLGLPAPLASTQGPLSAHRQDLARACGRRH